MDQAVEPTTPLHYDLILVFPVGAGGEEHVLESVRKKFNLTSFVSTMLGLREGYLPGGGKDKVKVKFRDEARCVFRTDRCFCTDQGNMNQRLQYLENQINIKSDIKEEVEELRKKKLDEMSKVLSDLYISHTGSDEPCTELQFRQLVIRAIATRLQITCGLTVRMRMTHDDKQVLMAVKADHDDLRVEAQRSRYKLQSHNHPFLKDDEYSEYSSHASAPAFNSAYRRTNSSDYKKAVKLCRDRCDTDHPYPVPDPGQCTIWHLAFTLFP